MDMRHFANSDTGDSVSTDDPATAVNLLGRGYDEYSTKSVATRTANKAKTDAAADTTTAGDAPLSGAVESGSGTTAAEAASDAADATAAANAADVAVDTATA